MKIERYKTENDAADAVLQKLRQAHRASGHPLRLFVPTGKSPKKIYEKFCHESEYWSEVLSPIQIDEFVDSREIFLKELEGNFLRKPELLKRGEFLRFDWSDEEMSKHVEKVLAKPVDTALLGMGPNGHVGFHEPGMNPSFLGGRVWVTEETRRRIPLAQTKEALTFGVGAFLKAHAIYLLVFGEIKRSIFEKFLESKESSDLPASLLKSHPQLTVITDIQK